ncbi:membrane progestin receptor gamma-A-like [Mizuhopecten yessoensis]|nr:membrane progestin receptor gamma-A-like [Mizuhopecten yessoensis]XP_021357095.1 membrane progestin receptor gamma-A-like [Mizuhopecten yessoensis]XP_021357096.1 membrane progestin receptor gamma-A-like [Mizuhopecten yessoensis]XP_021357097.1 membrane progestin receptor gamma-A-like [Mizuhopecten yessoensis]
MSSRGLSGPIYTVHQVPEHFHEHFIIRGYRHPNSTAKQCLLSVFDATNETLNFWTHFLPSCYFLWVLKGLSETLDFKNDPYTWPLLAYMFGAVIFPLASATAHTFNTMSDEMRHFCFFLDYGALSVFSLGGVIAYRAYSFPSAFVDTWFGHNFVRIATINSLVSIIFSCQTRFMKLSFFRTFIRLGSFGFPYLYNSLPIMYRLMFCSPEECALPSQYQHARQFIFAFSAAVLFATHFPERFYPAKFDIFGHSHQLFHVASILGTMDQMQAILHDMVDRRALLQDSWWFPSLSDSVGVLGAVMAINVITIGLFSLRLRNFVKSTKSS